MNQSSLHYTHAVCKSCLLQIECIFIWYHYVFLIVSLEYEELGIALVCFLFLADHSTTMIMNKLMMFMLPIIHLQLKTWLDCVVCLNFQTCRLHWHYDFHLLLIMASWVPLDREFRVKDSMMVKKTKWEIGFPNVKKRQHDVKETSHTAAALHTKNHAKTLFEFHPPPWS